MSPWCGSSISCELNTILYQLRSLSTQFICLNYVIRICRNARCFGLIVRAPHENRERVFGFTLPDDPNWPKELLLHRLAKLAADAVNRLDYVRRSIFQFLPEKSYLLLLT